MREDIAGPQGASSRPMWETLEGMVREKAQEFIQQIMEEEESRSPHPARRAERCPSGSPHTTRKRAETTTAGPRERADGSRSIRRPRIRQK